MRYITPLLLALVLLGAGCQAAPDPYIVKAQTWIETQSATYLHDGQDLEFKEAQQGNCAACWELWFNFTSSSAGFGDRSEEMSAQVMTPHLVRLKYARGTLMEVVIDETWDELYQRDLQTIQLPDAAGDFTVTAPAP